MEKENTQSLHVVGIGYAKKLFDKESREYARARLYANELGSYTAIVFTNVHEGFEVIHDGNLMVCPTQSKSAIGKIHDAYRIGKKTVEGQREGTVVVSAQDPFETSLVAMNIARNTNVRYHLQIHGNFFGSTFWRRESLLNRFRYAFGLWSIRKASLIRVVSERIKRSLVARGLSEQSIIVLPIQTEVDEYLSIERGGHVAEKEEVTILTAGRLSHEKNIPRIVESLAVLKDSFPHVQLRIVGSGPEEEVLQSLVKRKILESYVTFIPWVPSLVEELRRADIFALASNHEGYALVIVEAMAAGLPVVATDVGCAGDVLVDGVHGYVVPVKDKKAFTDALQKLIEDKSKRTIFGVAGREQVRTNVRMSPEVYAKAWAGSFLPSI